MSCSEARSASVTRLMSPLVLTLAVPRRFIRTLPASRAICIAKLSTGGPLGSRYSHLLRCNRQHFLNLPVPITPRVIARQFPVFVRNFLFVHELRQLPVVRKSSK